MMGESSAFTSRKEIQVFGWFRLFFKIFEIFEKFWKTVWINQKLRFLCAWWTHYSLSSFWTNFCDILFTPWKYIIKASFYTLPCTKWLSGNGTSDLTPRILTLQQYFQTFCKSNEKNGKTNKQNSPKFHLFQTYLSSHFFLSDAEKL